MSTLMVDPVLLPSSRVTVDRSTIARHLLRCANKGQGWEVAWEGGACRGPAHARPLELPQLPVSRYIGKLESFFSVELASE